MKGFQMIGLAMYTTIITLHKQGTSQRQIAKLSGVDRKTVRRIIKKYASEQIEIPIPYFKESKLVAWHEEIVRLLESNMSYVRILEELSQLGLNSSYSALTRYIKKHNISRDTCIRFHTIAGEEAQVDFGDIGKRYDSDGKLRKAYIFNMRLSYSRLDYYEVVFDQKISTWIKCHINAFEFFNGVPKYIKLDNLKAGILKADFYEPLYQRDYKRLADHYNFHLSPCRAYQPQEKGKVESGIKYVKNNFFVARNFESYGDMISKLACWLEKANGRMHGTTKKIPRELFESSERGCIQALPTLEFDMSSWHIRKVAKDCHITIENNYYSVPSKYVGMEVGILRSSNVLKVYFGEDLVATHRIAVGAGIFTTVNAHYARDKRYCPGFAEYDEKLEVKMQSIGAYGEHMLLLLKNDHKKDWHKAARGIISLRKMYSDDLIDKACKRALCYGISSYSKIKNILANNCYDLPLPDSEVDYARTA